jgi:hypothetical protein
MTQEIEFSVNGSEFFRLINKIRYVKSDKLLLLGKQHQLYAGFQEPQAIAWVNCGNNSIKKFRPISVNCGSFITICRHQSAMKFEGDSKLDGFAADNKFSARNIPIEEWQPDIEFLQFEPPKLDKKYLKFLKIIRPTLQLALSVDVSIRAIQVMYVNKTIMIAALAETGSLGYVGIWQLNKDWQAYFDKANFTTWLLPTEAVLAFLDENVNMIVDGTKTIIFGENYHIGFNQFGEAKPADIFFRLLETKPDIKIQLDFVKFFELLNKLPMGKTIELRFKKEEKQLFIEAYGYSKISVNTKAQLLEGKAGSIVMNHRQFKQIIGRAKDFKGTIEWSHFTKLQCVTDTFTHNWLLGRSYTQDKEK